MKRWQKACGAGILAVLAVYELMICVNAYLDLKYIVEPIGLQFLIERSYLHVDALAFGLSLNFVLVVVLFVCLWQKSDDR